MCQDNLQVEREPRYTDEDKDSGDSYTRDCPPSKDENRQGIPRQERVEVSDKNRRWVRSQRSQMTTGSQSDPRLPPRREEMLVSAPKLWSRRVR